MVRARVAEQAEGLVQGGQGFLVLACVGVDAVVFVGQGRVQGAAVGLVLGGAGLVGDAGGVGEEGAGGGQAVGALLLGLEAG